MLNNLADCLKRNTIWVMILIFLLGVLTANITGCDNDCTNPQPITEGNITTPNENKMRLPVADILNCGGQDQKVQLLHTGDITHIDGGVVGQNVRPMHAENNGYLVMVGALAHINKRSNTPTAPPVQPNSDGNIAHSNERNGVVKRREIKKFLVPIFVLTLHSIQYIKEGLIDDLLKKEFNDHGFPLPSKAKIVKEDEHWRTSNSTQTYYFKEEYGQLNVYLLFHGDKKCKKFLLKKIRKKLNEIHIGIRTKYSKQFPKNRNRMMSFYEYKRRRIVITNKGKVQGDELHVLMSLVDFSFIRSLVADCYSKEGGYCHDPVTVILFDLFAMQKEMTNKQFVKVVNHRIYGRQYRDYAGLPDNKIISEGTFTNIKKRIKEEQYNQILHLLVQIMTELGFITGEIMSVDGTLIPTYSRYKGCTHACEKCRCIGCDSVIQKIRERIKVICSEQNDSLIGKENRIFIECPNPDVEIPKNKNSKISTEVLCFTIEKGKSNKAGDDLAKKIGVDDTLSKQGFGLNIIRSNIVKFHPEGKDTVFINCRRIPSDIDAGIGCKRSKDNPNKKEYVFGFNAVIVTTVETLTGLELPIAVITIPGNGDEGGELIPLMEQIDKYHSFKTEVYVVDSGHDYIRNYEAIRKRGAIPLIDYNPRKENQSEEALLKRGYDKNGWTYAPCGALMKPNGFDSKTKRIKFCCFRECAKNPSLTKCSECSHFKNKTGCTKNMSIKEHPRLILEIPRGTKRYKKNYNHRTASERINSYVKDKCGIRRLLIRGLKNFSIKVIMACILTLVLKIVEFIIKATYQFNSERKCIVTSKKTVFEGRKAVKTNEEEIVWGIT